MRNLCAILSFALVYGLVRATAANALVSDVTFALFLLGAGLVKLALIKRQPVLRKIAARIVVRKKK